MKKLKIALGVIVLAFIALFIYQNLSFFMDKHSFDLNLYFVKYQTPQWPYGVLFLACFLIGFLIAFFMGLTSRYKARKSIKSLNSAVDSHLEMISELKKELKGARGESAAAGQPEVIEATVSAE